MSKKPILLIEDDRVDAMTVKRALKDLNVSNRLDVKSNGEEALNYLRNGENGKPCIILLDLNMPKMNGLEFLRIVKNDHLLKRIPVVVLTTSADEQDRIESYSLSIAGYMIKPVDYIHFVETMRTIQMYWTLSKLPA
ncbi:MAG: response regulator [bacterium]